MRTKKIMYQCKVVTANDYQKLHMAVVIHQYLSGVPLTKHIKHQQETSIEDMAMWCQAGRGKENEGRDAEEMQI